MDIVKVDSIKEKIFEIRGKQVMLDRDLAYLYKVKTFRMREQVKRNIKRFPLEFMFRLTDLEVEFMVSQNAIPSISSLGGSLPYVFTEQGVAMLSAVLRSEVAIQVSIQIMDAFVKMKKFALNNADVYQRLTRVEYKQLELDNDFNNLFNSLDTGVISQKQGIFYEGEIFDAYVFISKLIRSAKESIVIIDNYIDESVLTLLSKREKDCSVVIYTNNISKELELDVRKYNKQYKEIKIKKLSGVHDRFMIIDNKEVYHIGASLKDLGKKLFAFSRLEISSLRVLNKSF